MARLPSVTVFRLLGLGLLVLLGACAQQREPGYYDVPRDNTVSDARHRAQGESTTVAPAQLQFGFGAQEQAPGAGGAAGAPATATSATGTPAAGAPAVRANLPKELAETRTYLGTFACTDAGQCPATRMTLTLAPDGQWRARSQPVDGSAKAQVSMGCWYLTGTDPVRIVLQMGDAPHASMEFLQSNVLRLNRLNGQAPVLESRLTRQADIDPIGELSSRPAQSCPAQ